MRHHGSGVSTATPTTVFGKTGRLVPVRSAADFLRIVAESRRGSGSAESPVTIGGLKGFRVRVDTDPKPPYPALSPGIPLRRSLPHQARDVPARKGQRRADLCQTRPRSVPGRRHLRRQSRPGPRGADPATHRVDPLREIAAQDSGVAPGAMNEPQDSPCLGRPPLERSPNAVGDRPEGEEHTEARATLTRPRLGHRSDPTHSFGSRAGWGGGAARKAGMGQLCGCCPIPSISGDLSRAGRLRSRRGR